MVTIYGKHSEITWRKPMTKAEFLREYKRANTSPWRCLFRSPRISLYEWVGS